MLNFGNKEFRNLQEQVLKNAQDIETLKGREDLQIVIVNELPEVGNPNYIYLVAKVDGESPDVYDEYIWLEDEERYEKIGGVTIDLTNYVTTNTNQTITGEKTFTKIKFSDNAADNITLGTNASNRLGISGGGVYIDSASDIRVANNFRSISNGLHDLGSSSNPWKDLYLGGKVILGSGLYIAKDASNRIGLYYNDVEQIKIGSTGSSYCAINWVPDNNNTFDLGRSGLAWKDIYIAGNISNGTNTVSVANIASKTTSIYASGTFDSNGESTIDISGGDPEGLFIFTYGNCQCFLRLTATMVQNADTAPIRVSCPMIYNSATTLGWLNISRTSTTLTISVIDSSNHVDSGYAWTLTKTNLI